MERSVVTHSIANVVHGAENRAVTVREGIRRGVVYVMPTAGRALGGAMAFYGAANGSPVEVGLGLGMYAASARVTIRRDRR